MRDIAIIVLALSSIVGVILYTKWRTGSIYIDEQLELELEE